MLILSSDTTHGDCSVALLKDKNILSCKTQTQSGKQAEEMISLIEEVLNENGLKHNEIDAYAVNIGPGSFTGVRIGLAGVKGLNLVTGKPIIPITSFESVANQLNAIQNDILVVLDAKRKQVYTQLFDKELTPLSTPELMFCDELETLKLNENTIVTGNGSDLVAPILSNRKIKFEIENNNTQAEASSIAISAYKKYKSNNYSKDISPLYIRKPDAKKSTN